MLTVKEVIKLTQSRAERDNENPHCQSGTIIAVGKEAIQTFGEGNFDSSDDLHILVETDQITDETNIRFK
jgi:hypothetical protein